MKPFDEYWYAPEQKELRQSCAMGWAMRVWNASRDAILSVQVDSVPVAAQSRFRHPQKTAPDWSAWQPAPINLDRPSWEIDSQGFEVEYRLLYATPQSTEQQSETLSVVYVDGVGAGRRRVSDCRDGVRYITVADTVYWPLSADDAQRLRSAECGRGEFTGPTSLAQQRPVECSDGCPPQQVCDYCQQPAASTSPERTTSKDAEIECLRAEVAEWKRVAVAQAELHFEAEERAERLAQAARSWMEQTLNMLDKAGSDEYEARFGQCKGEPNHDNQ